MKKIIILISLVLSTYLSNSQTDNKTKSRNVIEYSHHEIHEGSSFVYSYQETLNASDTIRISIQTPNSAKEAHLVTITRSTAEANLKFYESPTFTGGTIQVDYNRNRNFSDTSFVIIKLNPTKLTAGTMFYQEHFGAGNNRGGESRGIDEFLLKRNTLYFIELVSEGNSNDCSLILDWYEHTDPRN